MSRRVGLCMYGWMDGSGGSRGCRRRARPPPPPKWSVDQNWDLTDQTKCFEWTRPLNLSGDGALPCWGSAKQPPYFGNILNGMYVCDDMYVKTYGWMDGLSTTWINKSRKWSVEFQNWDLEDQTKCFNGWDHWIYRLDGILLPCWGSAKQFTSWT